MYNQYTKDINADNHFIEADMRDDVNNTAIDFYTLVVQDWCDKVSIHLEDEMGDITPIGLFQPENKTAIQAEINDCLTKYPDLWINWQHKSFEGVHFQIRRSNGDKERFFRTETRGAFARRKAYAERNPNSVVSFVQFPVEATA